MDIGHQLADKELERIEKQLAKEYAQAEKEMRRKLKTFEKEFDAKTKEKREQLKNGKITKAEYLNWYNNKLAHSKWMQSMIDTYTKHQITANQRAADIINKGAKAVYAENYNYATYTVEKAIRMDTSFTLINEDAVRRLAMKASVNVPKDSAWHDRKIRSAVTQGMLQGERADKVSKRILTVSGMDERAAMRTARTMITGAQNSGRLDSYYRAADMGIKIKKMWVATLDDRTRASHVWLDGEVKPLDEPFSNDLMYPAEPSGDGEEIYNCRCTMITQLEGFERDPSDLGLRPAQIGNYEDWKGSHPKFEVINGKWQKVPSGAEIKVPTPQTKQMTAMPFAPAKTIQEAEQFAKASFIEGGFNLTGKAITYSGIDLDVANKINQRLNDIYGNFNINKLASLESFGKRNKKVYTAHKDAPMMATNFGNIGINSTLMKSQKAIDAYNEEGQKAFELVMSNIDKFSGNQRKIAESYKIAGRSLVGDRAEDYITHEVGHFISYMPDVNKKLSEISKTEWQKYAQHISGYANHSFGEYIAESFNAYYKGERKKLQPEMITIFDSLRR